MTTYAMISWFGGEPFWYGRVVGEECFERAFMIAWRLGTEVECMLLM